MLAILMASVSAVNLNRGYDDKGGHDTIGADGAQS